MREYWVPSLKWQLVDLLGSRYDKKKLERMTKKQLYAILFKIRGEK